MLQIGRCQGRDDSHGGTERCKSRTEQDYRRKACHSEDVPGNLIWKRIRGRSADRGGWQGVLLWQDIDGCGRMKGEILKERTKMHIDKDVIETHKITFSSEPKCTASEAIKWLIEQRNSFDENSPLYHNEIIINDRIKLLMPGKFDYKNPGDYRLLWDEGVPEHGHVGEALIKVICDESSSTSYENYCEWTHLLEDVYTNGTKNLDEYSNPKKRFAVQLLFWLTLQEDINKPHMMGRLRSFCRYAEALATTQNGFGHTLDEVKHRMDDHYPEDLEKWDLPLIPTFYKWNECAW